ncbi:MAG: TetR/AcrR family transcriptional regulator [Ectothiorhodospiraceae bacterium]|nr:TetR/AcrR family transcriptional regulator [Ectothiorhodospiraceae bacterium]
MFIDMKKRGYKLKKRAESLEATRARIVQALMELHEELGPRNTTISAIAERAGVQRLTVYRHFPDDTELFQACSSRWRELNPPPQPATWAHQDNGPARCRLALEAFYGYYRHTARMWTVLFRDEPDVPALRGPMNGFRQYLEAIAADLVLTLVPPASQRRSTAATVSHVLQFQTWASLSAEGLDDTEAAHLATTWVCAAATGAAIAPSRRHPGASMEKPPS